VATLATIVTRSDTANSRDTFVFYGPDVATRHARESVTAAGELLQRHGALPFSRSFIAAIRLDDTDELLIFDQAAARDTRISLHDDAEVAGDVAQLFLQLFRSRRQIRSALHVRAPHLAGFAVANEPLPLISGTGLLKRTPVPVPVVAWTPSLADAPVLETLSVHPLAPALLLANRGVLAWGSESLAQVASFIISLEEVATIAIRARILGGARALPDGAYDAVSGTADIG
jgi:hypothetical protein